MFLISEAEAADEVRKALEAGGEIVAVVRLRQLFLGLTPEAARDCVRTIAGWREIIPIPPQRRAARPKPAVRP